MYKRVYIAPSIFILILSLLSLLYFIPDRMESFSGDYLIHLSILTLINVIVFFITIRKYYPSWISYDFFFIIGFLIVHYQVPFLEAIGFHNTQPTKVWINRYVVNYAIWMSSVFLFLWMLGFYLFMSFRKKIFVTKKALPSVYIVTSKLFKQLFIISFIVFYVLVGKEFWSGNHQGSDNWGAGATYAFIFVRTFLYLSIIYMFYNNKIRLRNISDHIIFFRQNKLVLVLTFFYCLGFLLIGDRGPIMQVGLLYLIGYSFFVKHIRFSRILILFVLGSFLLTIIGMGRTRDTSTRQGNIFTSGIEKYNDTEDVNATNELAVQIRILYRALDVVPDKHPYLYGATLGNNIVDVIPMSATFIPVPKVYQSSTNFFTFLGQGPDPEYGEGSEIIADLYINLGVGLTFVIALGFGYFISFLAYRQQVNPKSFIVIIYFTLVIFALYINRANFLMPLKIIIYLLFFDKIFTKKLKIE